MQCGCRKVEVEKDRKESITKQYSANKLIHGRADTEPAATFKRVIGNTVISLQPMLGWKRRTKTQ
jgi:hypothetical protein